LSAAAISAHLGTRSIVLIGMMGVGKTSVGRRLAQRLELPFVDADSEIERAAGLSIPEIFAQHGEAFFRAGERRVVTRLLEQGPQVLATGGGAWMDADTRAAIGRDGLSIWLKADPELILRRVRKRSNRPLLKTADPEATLRALLAEREPVYALADMTVRSSDTPHEAVVTDLLAALTAFLR
jgi:shikimate kinase